MKIITITLILFICLLSIYKYLYKKKTCVVIGSGLAGLVCCISLLERNINVILIEKNKTILSSNSTLASSGINGSETFLQKNNDTNLDFFNDTKKSCGNIYNKEKLEILINNSSNSLEWLKEHQITLNQIVKLGGHSKARTHRNNETMLIGTEIMIKLYNILNNYKSGLFGAKLKIYTNTQVKKIEKNKIICTNRVIKYDYVFITSGGFSANKELINKYRPDLINLPTTNVNSTSGDGLFFIDNVKLIDMDKIQVHPTGFIDPENPNSNTKYLCAEILRGIGGILVNTEGKRFCNELGTREEIFEEMKKQGKLEFYIVVPYSKYEEADKHIDYYLSKKLLKKEKNIYPYLNEEYIFIGLVTPVIHYCMGGIDTTIDNKVILEDNKIIENVFAFGEVTGGVHKNNRLGGNSMLECVVYPLNSIEKNFGKEKKKLVTNFVDKELKEYSLDEVEKHNKIDDGWIIVNKKIYKIDKDIILNHVGGKDVIEKYLGKDITEIFYKIHNDNTLSVCEKIGYIK